MLADTSATLLFFGFAAFAALSCAPRWLFARQTETLRRLHREAQASSKRQKRISGPYESRNPHSTQRRHPA